VDYFVEESIMAAASKGLAMVRAENVYKKLAEGT
jgi:hypothetical protein